MGWAAAGAGLGLLKSQQDERQQRQANLAAAEQSRYSPFLAMNNQNVGPGELQFGAPTAFDRVLQGGILGGMVGQEFGKSDSVSDSNSATSTPGGQNRPIKGK